VSRYQKGKTNLNFTGARDSEWQWHQLGLMQVCTSLQTDNHASTPPLSFLQAGCPSCRPTSSVKTLKASAPVTTRHKTQRKHKMYRIVIVRWTGDGCWLVVSGSAVMWKVLHHNHLVSVGIHVSPVLKFTSKHSQSDKWNLCTMDVK